LKSASLVITYIDKHRDQYGVEPICPVSESKRDRRTFRQDDPRGVP
jgi:hypothetical protein